MSIEPILAVRDVSKIFQSDEGPLHILTDVSFELPTGGSLAITGPSGSGKTTLLAICAGLEPPTGGSVSINGQNLGLLDEEQRARFRLDTIGFVFQNFQLIPTLTALENVLVPLELRKSRDARRKAEAMLGRTGLQSRLHHFPSQLSGGEQQRVALARAFAAEPRILFADEPTGNLDAETGDRVADLLFELNRASGTSLIIVTHNPELAARCQTVLTLHAGRMSTGAGPRR